MKKYSPEYNTALKSLMDYANSHPANRGRWRFWLLDWGKPGAPRYEIKVENTEFNPKSTQYFIIGITSGFNEFFTIRMCFTVHSDLDNRCELITMTHETSEILGMISDIYTKVEELGLPTDRNEKKD